MIRVGCVEWYLRTRYLYQYYAPAHDTELQKDVLGKRYKPLMTETSPKAEYVANPHTADRRKKLH